MATINLLPWREVHRAEKKKEFITIFAVTVVGALILLFLWDRYAIGRIDWQLQRNEILKQEIAVLDKQVEEIKELKRRRQEMLDRMQVIQGLQSNRPEVVKLFDQLAEATPDGLFLESLERKGDFISLKGTAESNNRVSTLMRQLDESAKFTESNLTKVEANPLLSEDGSDFEMKVQIPPTVLQSDKKEGETNGR